MTDERTDYFSDHNGPTPLGQYLYHYTSVNSAGSILRGMTIRMGPYSQTNDPRETREWFPSLTLEDDVPIEPEGFLRVMQEVDGALRNRVQLACFTEDYDSGDPFGAPYHFHRGWARARMWQQYADDHRGVCLVLTRSEWIEAVSETVGQVDPSSTPDPAGGSLRPVHGPVLYKDASVNCDPGLLDFSLDELRRVGIPTVVAQHVQAHTNELFFRKNTDWQSEREFRSIVLGAQIPLFVPLRSALVAVVVGEHASSELVQEVAAAMGSLGRRHAVARCFWRLGAPIVVPALPGGTPEETA